jgi:hypothetical protein
MIIGISGKLGSGKDTVGLIIQALSEDNLTDGEVYEIATQKLAIPVPNWEIKKMAGKLKDIASILLGVSVEKFEDRAFKESKLGPEWNEMTVREFLQKLGTDAMRNGLHPNTWANAFWADYESPHLRKHTQEEINKARKDRIHEGIIHFGDKLQEGYPNWIITDVRFPNEAESVLDHGGILIRVNRGGDTGNHPSETGLDDWEFEYTINNNGTIKELINQVRAILEMENLL